MMLTCEMKSLMNIKKRGVFAETLMADEALQLSQTP